MEQKLNPIQNNIEKLKDLESLKVFLVPAILRRFKKINSPSDEVAGNDKNSQVENLSKSIDGEFKVFIKSLGYTKEINFDNFRIVSESDLISEHSINQCVNKSAENFAVFLLNEWTIDEVGKSLREYFLRKKPERIVINELVTIEVKKEVETELRVHLLSAFIKGPKKLLGLFDEAMKSIAKKIKNGDFENITKVVANESWVVEKNPELVKKAGFTISESDKTTAEISRSNFLERYGN